MKEAFAGMEFDHRCVWRITDDLAGELAALAATTIDVQGFDKDRSQFAGVILHCEGRHVAAMGFAKESDRTLTITDPVFLETDSAGMRLQWTQWLLQAMFQEAHGTGCRMIRSLQPVDTGASESEMTGTLTATGFAKKARVAVLEKYTSNDRVQKSTGERDSGTGPVRIREICSTLVTEILTATQWSTDANSEAIITKVVCQILAESADLQRLPVPLADDLLEDWRTRQVAIVLIRHDAQVIGLCAVATGSSQFLDDSESTTALIQYIGVIPECRRTGIASGFMTLLPQILMRDDQPEFRKIVSLRVFCDTENEPARRLYARCGFEISGELDVWCRETIAAL